MRHAKQRSEPSASERATTNEEKALGPLQRAQYSAFCFKVVRVFVFFTVDFGEPAIFCRGVRGLGRALELFTGKRQLAFAQ